MAFPTADSALAYTPELVSSTFIQQYYSVLCHQPELLQRFYMESGTVSRPDTNGVLATAQGQEAINNMIMSLEYLKGCVVEVVTEDAQPSQNDGIFILVTGYLTAQDMIRRKFSQSFFLALERKGCYFVVNDIFRFIVEIQKEPNQELPNGSINNVSDDDPPLPILDSQEVDIAQDCQARDTAPPPPPPETTPPVPKVLENGENVHGTSEKDVPESAKSSGTQPVSVKTILGTSEKAVLESEKSSSTQPISGKKVHGASEKAVPGSEKSSSTQSEKGDVIKENVVSASLKPSGTQPVSKVTRPIEKNEVSKMTYASVVKVNSSTPPVQIWEPTTKPTHVRVVHAKPVSGQPKPGSAPAKPVVTSTKPATEVKDNVGGYSIYVSNLPPDTTVEQVLMEFKRFGTIKPDGVQVRGHQIDRFCFAFVEFELVKSMEDAIQASPILIGDRQASVQYKRTRTRVHNGVVVNGGWRGNFPPGNGGFKNTNYRDNGDFGDGRLPQQRAFQNGDERPPQQRHILNGDERSPQHHRPFHNGDGRIPQQRSFQNGDGILPHQRAFYNGDGRYPQQRAFQNGHNSVPLPSSH